ncbi:hypothetical protein SD10_27150 [Spirosoma radiotolerans]|uniref:Uncharacterized protein n=1 Tax=Spirosoma radiotolerans TaxID=1379870 RepID=A0A0E4A075_9BACT|nr:hypothetical protein SD10_27150 [Spirosoma radiotolerans]
MVPAIMVLVLITAMDTGPTATTIHQSLFVRRLWFVLGIIRQHPAIMAVAHGAATVAVAAEVVIVVVVALVDQGKIITS